MAIELLSLRWAVHTLSGIRTFVEGEALWSKAQKQAVISLHQYGSTFDEEHFQDFKESLSIPLGDRRARLELQKLNPNYDVVRKGFIKGQLHPDDIDNGILFLERFRNVSYVRDAVNYWSEADAMMAELIVVGDDLNAAITAPVKDDEDIAVALAHVDRLNAGLTELEKKFSASLGAGSRWVEATVMITLFCAVLIVGSLSLLITIRFGRYLGRSIREIKNTAIQVGEGQISERVKVHSEDELGQLGGALNKMIDDLQNNIRKKEQAESANEVKSLFLANVSHEVRTPLGVILGLIEILKDPEISEENRQKYMGVIEFTGQNLQQIINDILDISKVETGHLEIRKSKFSLPEFIEEIDRHLQHLAIRTKNILKFQEIGYLPKTINTDPVRLRQILTNLVGNALKFTHEGKVKVTYWSTHDSIHFRVSDTGIGISSEEMEKLFLPFSQLDHSTTRKYGGTGLGLLLSKRFAQSLGGDLQLESSQPGIGSVFSLGIPFGGPIRSVLSEPLIVTPDQSQLKGKRVLVVEDSPENQMLIQLFLDKKDMQVECADNGKEGIEKATKNDYDLVLMDMQMPVVDGYTATEELRRRGYKTPIIALTAHAMKEDRERCMRVGCNDYLTKPIDSPVLYRTLAAHLA